MALRSLAGKLRGILPARATASRAAAAELDKLCTRPPGIPATLEEQCEAITQRLEAIARRDKIKSERYRKKNIWIRVGAVSTSLGFVSFTTVCVRKALSDDDI